MEGSRFVSFVIALFIFLWCVHLTIQVKQRKYLVKMKEDPKQVSCAFAAAAAVFEFHRCIVNCQPGSRQGCSRPQPVDLLLVQRTGV